MQQQHEQRVSGGSRMLQAASRTSLSNPAAPPALRLESDCDRSAVPAVQLQQCGQCTRSRVFNYPWLTLFVSQYAVPFALYCRVD